MREEENWSVCAENGLGARGVGGGGSKIEGWIQALSTKAVAVVTGGEWVVSGAVWGD